MKKKIIMIFSFSVVILFFTAIIFNFVICPKKYKNHTMVYAEEYGLDLALVYSVIKVESDFNHKAVSKSGAVGLMQILPSTGKWIAKELEVEFNNETLFSAEQNIRFGCFYLNYLFDKFNDMDIVICAYNAGERKVLDWIENGALNEEKIDYSETRNYLKKVNYYYRLYNNKLINLWFISWQEFLC